MDVVMSGRFGSCHCSAGAGLILSCPKAMGGEEGGKEKHRHRSDSLIRAGNADSPQTALFPWQQEDASKRTKFGTLPQMSWDFVVVSQLYIIIPYFCSHDLLP